MSNTPWASENWYTSPWNFAKEVTGAYNFNKNIKFHDVTLRDGEQQAGLIFNKDQKIAIADKLVELGVQRIEAGMPAVSDQDREAIEEIVKRYGDKTEVFAFARCMVKDVEMAAATGAKGVVVEIPSSEHLIKYAYKWELEKAIELSIKATSRAKELGLYTVFFPIDMTRADMDWVLSLVERVATEGHMDALALVDTFGGLNPHAVANLVKTAKARLGKPVETHFHDDFGLGSANTIMALAAGADVAHTTISAVGERAGNASYEDVALALLCMYGVDTGLDYSKIYGLSKYLQDMTGLKVRQNRGIVGDEVNNIESGIIADWFKNCKGEHDLELAPYLPRLTGHPETKVVIGKGNGVPSIDLKLEALGEAPIEDKDTKMKIVLDIKAKAFEVMRLLTDDEFLAIVKKYR